jgi:hypothetical protein
LSLKLRISDHKLPIEKCRHSGKERADRLCQLFNMNEIGDEIHFLFFCPKLLNIPPNQLRLQNKNTDVSHWQNILSKIFSDNSKISLKELARFICKGFKERLD